ncbi:MAG: HAD family hydrolase [Micavibrio sp.]|nr:MAG: HAD family hydrolase [Micavibrio sp.]
MTQNPQNAKNLLIVFDLVSTLTDAGPRYVRAFADICEKFGYPKPDEEEVLEMLGNKNLKEITQHFLGDIDDDLQGKFMQSCNKECDAMLFREDWHEDLFPHVRETLEKLHQDGYKLGIYTGTRENALEDQITYHGIKHLFNAAYIRGKDNQRDAGINSRDLKAAQLESLVERHRADCGDKNAPVLVIGDSVADAEAAADKDYLFIGFAANDRKKEKLQNSGVKYLMTDFADLPLLIKGATGGVAPQEKAAYETVKKKRAPQRWKR